MLLAESLLGSSSVEANYIEDVFSTWLYTGNSTSGGTQTITNGIDLSTKGGMVWIKGRSAAASNVIFDTLRGAGINQNENAALSSNSSNLENLPAGIDPEAYDFLSAFNTAGFTVKQDGTTTNTRGANYSGTTYTSWTFRKQPKFFDVVTYTGTGSARTISHSLGAVPGAIFIKTRNEAGNWTVYHRSVGNASALFLNATDASAASTAFNNTTPTSSVFSLGANNTVNRNGTTYVAYLFAHDAGGFGATGTDNVISCGSYTGNGSTTGPEINLGYEPQWLLVKQSSAAGFNWVVEDNMRGIVTGGNDGRLFPNTSDAENYNDPMLRLTATGFAPESTSGTVNASGQTYIYIAIRRGPMRTPTTGTSVYNGFADSTASPRTLTTGFPVDLAIQGYRNTFSFDGNTGSRLQGANYLRTRSTTEELSGPIFNWDNNTAVVSLDGNSTSKIIWAMRRAPGFFDVVCYTGTGGDFSAKNHNLGVVPELIIIKNRTTSGTDWPVWTTGFITGNGPSGSSQYLLLNTNTSLATNFGANQPFGANPTATTFTVGNWSRVNDTSNNYVAYLFASCPGVSKVGSYTGTGATQVINCGFAAGARFVLIKRTNNTGDWYVWDSARGIVAGNDPYLTLNTAAAEVINTDWVDTAASGFELSNAGGNLVNTNGASYIFLAVS